MANFHDLMVSSILDLEIAKAFHEQLLVD